MMVFLNIKSSKKFDILLRPKDEPQISFVYQVGGYREPKSFYA